MSRSYDCADDEARRDGIADAASTVRKGELVVLPTDTVYGIGADAFSPAAVASLLKAKGRGRDMPPPVLVGSVRAAHALIEDLGGHGQDLIDEFWPGPLTIVCRATPSLSWDLGDTQGTVAVRMPMHPVAIELLKETGPMAVSSANLSGRPAATRAEEAAEQLGDSVSVYLDGGLCEGGVPSTIVDLTYAVPRVLRSGAIPIERLRAVCGTVIGEAKPRRRPDPEPEAEPENAEGGPEQGAAAEAGDGAQGAADSAGTDSGKDAGTDAPAVSAEAPERGDAAAEGPESGPGGETGEPSARRSE
ncbi:L-threonylcarbamoyladenylate synthase [Nocardiopsis potens]|uniref:L-threonylcarbamoyladenylate synthase n=1 Tax=Nocardiopsis potens TaxID=1246458 RepID=UPI000348F06D|nr:L-threonylcarbamoyladenylate synthase [Nocardiopsis potens]